VNVRHGLFRLWIVASVIWVVAWLSYIWATCETHGNANAHLTYCYTDFSGWMSAWESFSFWEYARIAGVALGFPAAILIVGWALLWALGGFREKSN
jgi:hypothetical protein